MERICNSNNYRRRHLSSSSCNPFERYIAFVSCGRWRPKLHREKYPTTHSKTVYVPIYNVYYMYLSM